MPLTVIRQRADRVTFRNNRCGHVSWEVWRLTLQQGYSSFLISNFFAVSWMLYAFFWVIPGLLILHAPTCLWRWNRVFRNVGIYNSDAGESPKRNHTTPYLSFPQVSLSRTQHLYVPSDIANGNNLQFALISCFHRALLQSITLISRLNEFSYTKL